MGKLTDRVALVTGAASGIGRASAVALAREGAAIMLADIQDMAEAASEIEVAGSRAVTQRLDVSSEAAWIEAVAAMRQQFGRLDILVNNAGMALGGDITTLDLADWKRQIAVNLDGPFLGMKHGLPLMREGGGGSIVNIASTTALVGAGALAAYAATKGAVVTLSKSVARQCAALKDGVRVNTVLPGIVDTPIYGTVKGVPVQGTDPIAMAASLVPLGRAGSPADIAGAVVYLASDEARYITGADFVIDGGLVIH